MILKIKAVVILFLLFSIPSISQLNLELMYIDTVLHYVDVREMPRFKAHLRASYNNSPLTLNVDNVIVIESNRSNKPISVKKINDWYEIIWLSNLRGYDFINYTDFIVTHNNTSSKTTGFYTQFAYPKIYIRNQLGFTTEELHFGTIPEGVQTLRQVKITALKGRLNKDSMEMPVRIDSITLTTPYFTYNWQGNEFDRTPPPVNASLGSNSLVDIYFRAGSNDFHSDVFTVHYENGFSERVYLTANKFHIDYNTILQLNQPISYENLSPCEIYPISWKGSVPGLPTKVYFSSNNGSTWIYLGLSNDSLFHWIVPKTYTNSAKIKIKQEFSKTNQIVLRDDIRPIEKVVYNPGGTRLLAVFSLGKISEWDTKNYKLTNTYYLNNTQSTSINYDIYGINYIKGDSIFAVAYNIMNSQNSDTIAFFKIGAALPFSKFHIDRQFRIKEMIVDSKKNHIALIPVLGNQIAIFSTQNGEFSRNITFDYPIGTMSYHQSGDTALVYLLNGEVILLNVPDYDIIKRINLSHLPIIETMSISPSGKFLAIGCKTPQPTKTSISLTEIHVLHLDLEKIVRSLRKTSTDPVKLEFNPASTVLIIGSQYNPQISYLDMISGDYIGNFDITNEKLNHFALSPDGHSLAAASSGFSNLAIQYFAYPEEYISPGTFNILEPIIELASIERDSLYLGESKENTINLAVCNKGLTNVRFNSIRMKYGVHFFVKSLNEPQILAPNECFKIDYISQPLDTGIIRDTIIVYSECYGDFLIPIEIYSRNRNIKFLVDNIDFGERCIGTFNEKNIELIANLDPVPLKINFIEFIREGYSPFYTRYPIYDTTIQAHSDLKIPIIFKPMETIKYDSKVRVYHSNQKKIFLELPISGKGIGNNLTISHSILLFIPEIPERIVKIINNSDHTIILTEAIIDNQNDFDLLTSFPLSIPPFQEASIHIRWKGTGDKQTKLTFKTEPCLAYFNVFLGRYIANSKISIPALTADPRENLAIPINYVNTENGRYAGERFFEGEIILNKKLFFPLEINSSYGIAEFISNRTDNQFRYIKFNVLGDFPSQGTVAEIVGIAGIADTTFTEISFSNDVRYWGDAVNLEFNNGTLNIIGICNDRLILHNDGGIKINSIVPNPTSDKVTLNIYSLFEEDYQILIYNQIGMVLQEFRFTAKQGENSVVLDISKLTPASYRIVVRSNNRFDTGNLVILK